jgi:hypothetical protein
LPVAPGSNAVAVAPDGKHAVVYYDPNQGPTGVQSDSWQDMTVVDLSQAKPTVHGVTVGYNPTSISFAENASKAFVVTVDGVSIFDLAEVSQVVSKVADLVPLYTDANESKTADVLVTPDGSHAVSRQPRQSLLRLVDLANKARKDLDLLGYFADADAGIGTIDVSDIEIAPDGSFALAVVRDQGAVLRVPIPAGFDDPSATEKYEVPSGVVTGVATIGPDGHYGVLYTTVTSPVEQRVTLVDFTGALALRTIGLHKTVAAVAFGPTNGNKAYVLHQKSAGDPNQVGISADDMVARSYAYSVVDLPTGQAKLVLTATMPGQIAALPDGTAFFVLFSDAPWQVERIGLVGFDLMHFTMGSQPTGIGLVAQVQQVFVSQAHPDGRMTFIDWDGQHLKSVTGYELNSNIWE